MSTSVVAARPRRRRFGRLSLSALCLAISLFVLAPLAWILSLALKGPSETVGGSFLPKDPQLSNFGDAWSQFALGTFVANSVIVTVASVALTVVAAICAAYAFTKLRFRGSETTFSLLLVGVIIPPAALVVPLLIEVRQLNLYNSHVGLTLAYVAFGLPLATLILRGFFERLPHELIEAARLDGCSEWAILWRIVVPLSKSAIATVTILLFLANWNEFIVALVLLRDTTNFTLPLGINAQIGQYTSQYNLIAAASLIASVPVFLLYLALQRQFERGVAEGALKG
jgi:ABC-type glycerol-3-phosphate transport system permease component